ncbi:metal-binding protein [Betaproteobacteria bacterium]|nr:metal-binding protein [Betaproteobacteria bacterium]GHT99743.1 metal-binding protein [Betaproteobacteria bacterium]GHU23828.1 metal-binding protein [Betaproteobacteria bacterium]
MDVLIALIFAAILLTVGFVFGSIEQRRHYRSIKQREVDLRDILLFNEKHPPPEFAGQPFALVCGSVVMGSDHFRQFVAGLKAIFGGRLTSFEAMLDRGRREAILRMKEEAGKMGAKAVFNVRMETSTLSYSHEQGNGKAGLACVELVVYGTAWCAPGEVKPHGV